MSLCEARAAELGVLERELIDCRACPRLVEWREQVAREKRAAFRDERYWGRPVPGFGDPAARPGADIARDRELGYLKA